MTVQYAYADSENLYFLLDNMQELPLSLDQLRRSDVDCYTQVQLALIKALQGVDLSDDVAVAEAANITVELL